MTNDLTTVNGSFQQLIDELEENLAIKGVDAEFDSTTGIRGLVDEIKDIKTAVVLTEDLTKYNRSSKQFEVYVYEFGEPVTVPAPNNSESNGLSYIIKDITNNTENTYLRPLTNGYNKFNINLSPNEYEITTRYKSDSETVTKTNTITVLSRIVSEDLILNYYDGTKFAVTILDDFGEPVGAGESVTFNINGVIYNRTTNSSGIAMMSNASHLMPGEHIVTTTYNGETKSNHITVKENIELSVDKDILSYGNNEDCTITATLFSPDKANKTLSYTIKHDSTILTTGTCTTNNDGEASFTYSSQGIGEVTIEVTYNDISQTYSIYDVDVEFVGSFNDITKTSSEILTRGYGGYVTINNIKQTESVTIRSSNTTPYYIVVNINNIDYPRNYNSTYDGAFINIRAPQIVGEYPIQTFYDVVYNDKRRTFVKNNTLTVVADS